MKIKNKLLIFSLITTLSFGGYFIANCSYKKTNKPQSSTIASNLDVLTDIEIKKLKQFRNLIMNYKNGDNSSVLRAVFLPKKKQWINMAYSNTSEALDSGKDLYKIMQENDSVKLYNIVPYSGEELTDIVIDTLKKENSESEQVIDEDFKKKLKNELTSNITMPGLEALQEIGLYSLSFYSK